MPTYPYACTACDNRFEVVQAFSDDALTVCDVCGGRLRKVFSSVGVVFKGSGFYRNDSRSSSGSSESSGETKVSAPAASGDGAKPSSSDTSTTATPTKTETAKPASTPSSSPPGSTSSQGAKESAA
ncbi:MAG: FmdB family zinc ribbon protein [Actinomycetota bacterium]